MNVALISDLHANYHALQAVLAHSGAQAVDAVWNLGDSVGYGAFPDEVVQWLRKEDVLSIIGNYDLRVLKFKDKKEKWRNKKPPEKYRAYEWTYEHLSKKNRKYLRFLSQEIRVKVQGHRILLTHGSPDSNEEALTAQTSEQRLQELAAMAKVDIVLCGHSHRAFARSVDGVYFINPGSVGRPDDGDPRASYGILRLARDQVAVDHFRLEYDVDAAVQAIRAQRLPELFAQMLLRGRSMEDAAEIVQDQGPVDEPQLDAALTARSPDPDPTDALPVR